jgi:hypothetical protein
MRKSVITLLCVVALPAVTTAANMREGLWEIQSQMDMPGMPMKVKPTVVRHCYTREDVKDQQRVIARDSNCKVTELKSTGSKVSWTMKCTGKNAATMTGETVFGTDSYTSLMHMKSGDHSMTTRVKAKRVGNCP